MRTLPTRRRKDPAFWNAINRVLVILLVILAMIGLALWFYPQLMRRNAMSRNLQENLLKELQAQTLLRKQRERQVYLLENDRAYIEMIARDKLDLMKEGETIFRLEPTRPAAESAPSPRKK